MKFDNITQKLFSLWRDFKYYSPNESNAGKIVMETAHGKEKETHNLLDYLLVSDNSFKILSIYTRLQGISFSQ